jgi:transposase
MERKMANEWGAVFVETDIREVCTNADEVVRQIKNANPGETTESLSRHAGVSFQTVQRWLGSGRADGLALRRLLAAFTAKKTTGEKVYLDKATPKQLYDRCAAVGWDVVIQAGREKNL